ncbi:lipid droplet defective [Arctopsyche grandis]|uniref:lipid droplet defective n=1 Tax=Arctopsyche grandis TaxID=121162 RepID=UPI00406D9B78
MSSSSSQLWLLLWKDYLIRKRKPITIGGVVWAAATIISLVIVRSNVYPDEKPTCQFASRALPSAGVLPFLQSFICTINNECNPLDEYEEIPSYDNSGLTSLQNQFLPIFQNESVMETVEVIPNALKLLATLTRLIDNKEIESFVYNGFRIGDVFKNPQKVEVILSDQLKAPRKIFNSLLQSSINLDYAIGHLSSSKKLSCDGEIFQQFLISKNIEDIADVANVMCNMSFKDLEKISISLIYEINIKKYFGIIGTMANELTGKPTLNKLGEMFTSIIQLTNFHNYIPKEFQNLQDAENHISYIDMNLIQRMVTVFEPLFSETDAYKFILSGTNTFSNSLDFISNVINSKVSKNPINIDLKNNNVSDSISFEKWIHINDQLRTTISSVVKEKTFSASSVLNVLSGIVEISLKMLPNDSKHQFLYFMTLIDKMIAGAYNTLRINLHMEEVMYNVSARHPKGIEKISKLGPVVIGKIIDGLTDVNRVQVFTRKIYHSAQMFCDLYKLQVFLKITREEATRVKPIVCDSIWKSYVNDVVESFGVNNISSTISKTASFVVSETLGKDNEARFIKPQDFFHNIGIFINYVIDEAIHPENNKTKPDWRSLFNYSNYDAIEAVLKSKLDKTDVLLVTVNTALAREVISNNAILETFITPTLIKLKLALSALSKEVGKIPKTLIGQIKENFISILEVILSTLNDKEKTINILTVDQATVLCELVEDCTSSPSTCKETLNNNQFINYPSDKDSLHLTKILCNITTALYEKLNSDFKDDVFLSTINLILNDTELGKGSNVNWDELISTMQQLYVKLNTNFGFILNSKAHDLVNIHRLVEKLELEQFTINNMDKALQISVSVSLSALQIMDRKVFGLNRVAIWNKVKDKMVGVNSLFYIANQLLKTLKALITSDEQYAIDELPITSKYIKDIVFNLPSFIRELATFIAIKDVDVQPFIELITDENSWPCSNSSIANIMMFNTNASNAMKAIEAIFCADETLKTEWDNFDHVGKIAGLVTNSSYNDKARANTFSMTARSFNGFVTQFSDFARSVTNIQINSQQSLQNELLNAWKYAINITSEIHVIRHTIKNIDALLNATRDYTIDGDFTPSKIWETSIACTTEGGEQMVTDLIEYFDQILVPNPNVLQLLGFTRKTGPYIMFSKFPEFLDALMNSFLDQDFMKQVYRSLGKQFWDCERILDNIVIPTNARITKSDIKSITPYICPSFIYWVSVPINENVLLDLFAKSQFIFFSKPISDFNATFETLLENSLILNEKLTQFSKKKNTNFTFVTDDWLNKFQNIGRTVILTDDDITPSTPVTLRVFNSSYAIETLRVTYLSEITNLLIFIDDNLKNLNESNVEIRESLNQDDLKLFLKFIEKKSSDMIEILAYAIAEELLSITTVNDFSISNSFERVCNNNTKMVIDKTWIKSSARTLKSVCKTEYKKYIELLYKKKNKFDVGIREYVETLNQIDDSLQYIDSHSDKWKRVIFDVFKLNSTNSGEFLKIISKYSYDFDLKAYFQYLNMKLEHYLITLNFVTGNDWWSTLRMFYNKTYSNMVLDLVENSPKIVDDIITNLSRVKIVRLIKDIKLNSTEVLCTLNISDYVPDSTGYISKFMSQLCQMNTTSLYMEIQPIQLAAQVYDDDYITSEILTDSVFRNNSIKIREVLIDLLNRGPRAAMLPNWISAENIANMKNINGRITTESAKTDLMFFVLNNLIDGITLFMNSTSSAPSVITPWIKQINLQLIKKDEYAVLMCDLHNINLSDVYSTLINDFHWDLALSEIIAGRNFTWMEMNKSLNQLLEHVRQYIRNLDSGQLDKLSICFFNSSISNPINKMSLYVMLGSHVMKLIRASSPHFKDIKGFSTHPTWQYLFNIMKNNLPVDIALKDVIKNSSSFPALINAELGQNTYDIIDWKININKIFPSDELEKYYYEIYHNGSKMNISSEYIDISYISDNIQILQHDTFWSLDWLSNIISAIERSLWNLGHVVQKLSVLDWDGLTKFQVNSVIDFTLQMVQKSYIKAIASHVDNIITEFNPIIDNLEIEHDLKKFATGLSSISPFIDELMNSVNIKFEMNNVFYNWDNIKNKTHSNTNLTLATLNTIQSSLIDLSPLLNSDSDNIHIGEFICKRTLFSTIFHVPKNYDQKMLRETQIQLCKMTNNETLTLAVVLLENINYTAVFDGVVRVLIDQIVYSSNLTTQDGETVIKNFGNIIGLMPSLRQVILNVSEVLANEPIIKSFQRSSSLSNLLYDPKFFDNVGNMMCGKPFVINTSRFYKVIAEVKDSITEPDHKQLESLPNDYCREFYEEILKMDGGKILWSYAKPMLMGKILYTPNNMNIHNIIVHVNETFSQIGRLFTLLHDFSDGFSSLDNIIKHNVSLFTMQKLLKSSFVQDKFADTFGENFSSSDFTNIDLNSLIDSFGNSTFMKEVLNRVSSMSSCILLNRFVPMNSEKTLEERAARLMEANEFSAGIVFMDTDNNTNTNIQYKIRMDIDNVPSTSRLKNRFWMPGPNGNFLENLRYFRGFVQLQDMIDQAIIISSQSKNHSNLERIRRDAMNNGVSKWGIHTQQMPYPCYIQDEFKTILYESQALVIAFFFSLILVVASVVRHLVWERESGNTSLMCVMRLQRKNHTLSWFIASLIEVFITMAALCIILKFGNILPKSNTFALLLVLFNFGFSVVMFCYMVTSFFKSASLGAVSAVIIYLIFFMPYVIVISLEALLTLPQKIITSLFMSTGFCYTILLIARFEVQGVGLQWMNINESPLVDDPISVANTCIIVIFDALIYFIIGYIINYIRFNDRIHVDVITNNLNNSESSIGVRIENVTKVYKNRDKKEIKALDNVNIDLYKGHITTLLGHNGAGKTTLIKILTGITEPNSGKIIINKQTGIDNVVKNHIGLCPQADILLELMSSREHLIYYARLKTDSNHGQVKYDVDSMLEIMGLVHLSEEPVCKLSGGLRRRLSVGLAFIANPHLVILDEPSSGVDPVARRDIWSLIVSLKGNRTILLTTHHLDEAELLSDTLIIMHKGKILTSGSPLELKHKYGSGYNLTVTFPSKQFLNGNLNNLNSEKRNLNSDIINELDYEAHQNSIEEVDVMTMNAKHLLNNIREIVTNATLDTVNMNNVKFNLPFLSSDGQCHNFSSVLQLLEERKLILKFSNLNMECSSLEQVFLDICKKADSNNSIMHDGTNIWEQEAAEISSDTISSDDSRKDEFQKSDRLHLMNENGTLHGSFTEQMLALLKKRFLHYHRNYRVLIITLLLPAVFVAFAMGFSLIRPPDDSEDPLNLSSSLYNKFSAEFVTLQENPTGNIDGNHIIRNIMNNSIKANNRTLEQWIENTRDCKCIDGYQKCIDTNMANDTVLPMNKMMLLPTSKDTIDWIINTQDIYTEKRYGGWSSTFRDSKLSIPDGFTVWYNNKGDHALPAYMNTLSNAIFKYKSNDKHVKITTYNHPLKLSQEQLSRSTLLQHVADVGIGVVLLIGFSLVPAGGAIYLVNERTSQEKRLQLLSGVSPFTYWISALIWDLLIIIGAIILALCVFEIFALPVYLYKENIPAISLLLLLYGISCSTLMHILEKFFVDASLANMILFCSNVFIGVVGLTILLIIDVLSTSEHMDYVRWALHKVFLICPQFALGDGLVEISKNTIQASVLSRFGMDTYLSPLGWELMGCHYLSLTLTAILFFLINMLYEYHLLDSLFAIFQKENHSSIDIDKEDCDVITEKYRVELATLKPHYNMGFDSNVSISKLDKLQDQATKLDANDVLQILSLRKVYSGVLENRVAVDSLTFGVKPAQCFGLLGVNGAGKSTTFKMLTGEIKPTDGQIFILGKLVTQRELCNGLIAYCPQVDSLDRLLTVTEHLDFYSSLRGLTNKTSKIKSTLKQFDLLKYSNQQSNTLSGGNKRKLCTAISLMGNSPIVLLDEPTSGMDPGARFNTGNAIQKAIKAGRCILLSSHSLIECESLCQTVAVTALGKFLAIGPPNYLKHKYGGGYLVSIRLASPNQKGQLIQSMSEMFPQMRVQNSHYCTTQFLVPVNNQNGVSRTSCSTAIKELNANVVKTQLSDIFSGLSQIDAKLNVIDYSINQSSLDQVFINFSHSRDEKPTRANDGQIKLSTLERQYSKNKDVNLCSNYVITKF